MTELTVETLPNGLTLIVEEMSHVESAAYDLHIPGGIVTDKNEVVGSSLLLAELTSRGAGGLSSRELSEAFEDQGIRHSEAAVQDRFIYHGSFLAEKAPEALNLLSWMVRRPALPEAEIESIRSLLLQEIASLADQPARLAMVELQNRYFPQPYNRPSIGTAAGIQATTLRTLKGVYDESFKPGGAVLSLAGNVKTKDILNLAQEYFGSWGGTCKAPPAFKALPELRSYHVPFESAQLQITMAYPSARYDHPHYYTAKIANGVLSSGMHGRLFVEVREKRGLCYSVYSRHSATNNFGAVFVYAGTTPERAQETLDVLISELRSLRGSISQEEISRAKANLKTSLILGEESSSSRASSNAGDWWLGRRVRTLPEIESAINKIELPDVDDYLGEFSGESCMLLTLGSRELKTPSIKAQEVK